jgi:precorrin-2 methylase
MWCLCVIILKNYSVVIVPSCQSVESISRKILKDVVTTKLRCDEAEVIYNTPMADELEVQVISVCHSCASILPVVEAIY